MSVLKTVLLVAAVLGIGVGMVRSEGSPRPVEQNYDGYGARPTYGREVYADSVGTRRREARSDIRDLRAKCLDMKTLQEKFRCMELTDD